MIQGEPDTLKPPFLFPDELEVLQKGKPNWIVVDTSEPFTDANRPMFIRTKDGSFRRSLRKEREDFIKLWRPKSYHRRDRLTVEYSSDKKVVKFIRPPRELRPTPLPPHTEYLIADIEEAERLRHPTKNQEKIEKQDEEVQKEN